MDKTIKDAQFGVIGGIAGTAVLFQVMGALSKMQSEEDVAKERKLVPEPPTEKLARRVAQAGLGIVLSKERKARLGRVIQWSYGAICGGFYGVLRNRTPAIRWAGGLPYRIRFVVQRAPDTISFS